MNRVAATTAEASARMKRIRSSGTEPELAVRRALRQLGVRYRACPRPLPGTPDLANQTQGWAIFVHGCFWHGHRGCRLFTTPKTNTAFWEAKVEANRERDGRKSAALRRMGMQVITVWQCETRHPERLERRLSRLLKGTR